MHSQWAQQMITSSAVLLDTETTGLNPEAQIVQLAIIDMAGNVLFDSLLRPTHVIPHDAIAIHGITNRKVEDAPILPDVVERIKLLLTDVPVIIYNARFDIRLLEQSLKAFAMPTDWLSTLDVHCAMRRYSLFMDSSKWLKLDSSNHTAVGDCRATLELLRRMAREGKDGTTNRHRAFRVI